MKHVCSRLHAHASKIVLVATAALMAARALRAGTTVSENRVETSSKSWLAEWWNGKYAGGNWFGARDTGIKFDGYRYIAVKRGERST